MSPTIHFDAFGATTPIALPAFLLVVVVLLYAAHQYALPRPIPGIPYNKEAAQRVLGDLPELYDHIKKTDTVLSWLTDQAEKLKSPIFQVFARPMQKPWVILYDFKESEDILMRRGHEFDSSDFFSSIFEGVIPEHHLSKRSYDPQFKKQKIWLKDIMAPTFLNTVLAPRVYSTVEALVRLWETKTDLAKGHPFALDEDIFHSALDVMFAAVFATPWDASKLHAEREWLLSAGSVQLSPDIDTPAKFPHHHHTPVFDALLTLCESFEVAAKSPAPRLHHWVIRQLPYMRKAKKNKDDYVLSELKEGIRRLEAGERAARCALDDMLQREQSLAEKECRRPDYINEPMIDELAGLLIGGMDTTACTLCWGLKYLTDYTDVQNKFRSELRKTFATAAAEQRNPTVHEIVKARAPYMEAVIEEVVRTSLTAEGTAREALVDTTVLGYLIPKGTEIFCMWNGPGFFSDGFDIPDAMYSPGALKGRHVGSFNPRDLREFKPERWLAKDEVGNVICDPLAGPQMGFGLGARSCFGRKLAYLEMRITLVLICWNFVLKRCPAELSSYDAVTKLTRMPKQAYLKLEKIEL